MGESVPKEFPGAARTEKRTVFSASNDVAPALTATHADMPNSLEEIVASEKQYLQAKEKHPVTTDIRYFSKAIYNIVFKKARSR